MTRALLPLTAALAACLLTPAVAPAQSAEPQRVEVLMNNFEFTPSTLHLHHGQTYVLHLVNQARGGHSFQAPEFFASASAVGPVVKGTVEVKPLASVDVTVTPAKAGAFHLKCSHTLHASFGMAGEIVVD